MKRYLKTRKTPSTPNGKSWMIVENLDGAPCNYIMNKADFELSPPNKGFNSLTQLLGRGSAKLQIRITFTGRTQSEEEVIMLVLDEEVTRRQNEIM